MDSKTIQANGRSLLEGFKEGFPLKGLRRYRMAAGYTQAQLADLLGITGSHLNAIERLKTLPSYRLLCLLCFYLDACPSKLIFGVPETKKAPVAGL